MDFPTDCTHIRLQTHKALDLADWSQQIAAPETMLFWPHVPRFDYKQDATGTLCVLRCRIPAHPGLRDRLATMFERIAKAVDGRIDFYHDVGAR